MNREWSEKSKEACTLIGKESTYKKGIQTLLELRKTLMDERIENVFRFFPKEAFSKQPFRNVKGYSSKTIAYSIYHIMRIEDIVAHELILRDEQIFFRGNYQKKLHSPIITTGNELVLDEIAEFSEKLDLKALQEYAEEVYEITNQMLLNLPYAEMKRKFSDEDKERLLTSNCISTDENAAWLIDYWCSKDVRGLLKMPFSRHWIMHVEAFDKIKAKLCKDYKCPNVV